MIPFIIQFQKPAENTLQDQLNTRMVGIVHTDMVITFRKTPLEYYQQSGQLLSISTLLTVLQRHKPHQQEMDMPLKTFSP